MLCVGLVNTKTQERCMFNIHCTVEIDVKTMCAGTYYS
jgi:hypothetical protein